MSIRRDSGRSSLGLALLRWAAVSAFAFVTFVLVTRSVVAFDPWWVQSYRETQLWSGPDARAIPFGSVPQWSYFQVVAPQQGSRLYVFNSLTTSYAYVDAAAVGPSAPPPPPPPGPDSTSVLAQRVRTIPKLPSGFEPSWVANFLEADLWAGAQEGAASLGTVPQFRRLMVAEPQSGNRLRLWWPEKEIFGYMDASVLGPSGSSLWMEPHPVRFVQQIGLPGRSIGDKSYVRNMPVRDDETEMRWAPNNTALDIRDAVTSEDGVQWYTVGGGGYIRASEVRLPRPVEKPMQGRWVDADLKEPAMISAYEGDKIVYSALAIKGVASNATPTGTFQIWRRVDNEIMDSETLQNPIPKDSPGGYYLKDVLYTQYFTYDGSSFHYNYWLGTFGYPGSHGCLGLNLNDAKWLWDWAAIGTPVVVR